MYLLNEDTICAPATIPGTGAISVIRVSGGDALRVVSAIVKCSPGREVLSAPGYSMRFGRIFLGDGSLLDEVIVSVFRAPHSYTGEDSAEIFCHASKYIVDNIMYLLLESGARPAEPGEFTRRAFLNGKMDLAQAEAVADLISAQNASAHRVALSQLKGGFSVELRKMRDELLNIVSLMELELDFSEEEVEFADRSHLSGLVEDVVSHIDRLVSSFRLGNVIKNGIPVAIAGATNTGKSTLLNALLGEDRAIVSDVHGTTRDTIEETLNVGGLMFRFIDTAGIRITDEIIEKIGIERTFRKVNEASVVMAMVDISRISFSPSGPDTAGASARSFDLTVPEREVSAILDRIDPARQKVLFVLNKADILNRVDTLNNADALNKADVLNNADILNKADTLNKADVPAGGESLSKTDMYAGFSLAMDKNGEFTLPESWNKNVNIVNIIVSLLNNQLKKHNIREASLVLVSAKKGEGIDALKSALSNLCREYAIGTDATVVTNLRHVEALKNASETLSRVRQGLASEIPTDLVSQDIREALYYLGSIVGEISTDEVLGRIFEGFCIGK